MHDETITYAREHWRSLYTYSPSEYDQKAARYRYNFRRHLPVNKKADILDVGSAGGFFLYFLRQEGFQNIQGIDPDGLGVAAARKIGLCVEQADAFAFLANPE